MAKSTLKKRGIKIFGGLLPTKEDPRDIKFGALYTLPKLSEIPDEFEVAPVKILDQGESDLCTAYASTYASSVQEGVTLSPEYQFKATKKLMGHDPVEWGADLRVAMKSLLEGSLPVYHLPAEFKLAEDASNRDHIANWNNWPEELDKKAFPYRKGSYMKVSGPYDLFDNIRATMWHFKQLNEKRLVVTGAVWRHAWTQSKDGVIEDGEPANGFGHAFAMSGVKKINGELYLILPLSNGETIGDMGKFYMPRSVVNKELIWGAYTTKDISPEIAKYLHQNQLSANWQFLAHFVLALKNLFK